MPGCTLHLGMLRRAEISTVGHSGTLPKDVLAAGVITASNWAVSVLSCRGERYLWPHSHSQPELLCKGSGGWCMVLPFSVGWSLSSSICT